MTIRDSAAPPAVPDFLMGGDQMGALMRATDWSATSLGQPSQWAQPLKTLVSVMLGSNQPMFVTWGAQRTLLYNDAYACILAAKHPEALGADFLDVWSEIRGDLEPIVEQAYAGRAVHMDDIELTMHRHGYAEETHFAFSYTPVRDDCGTVKGFFCPCIEITEQVFARRRHTADAERQRRMFEQAPGFIAILSGPEHVFEFTNAAYRRLIGNREVIGKSVRNGLPELEGQAFFELLDRVFTTGERFVAERSPIRLDNPGANSEERFLDFIYEPITNEARQVTGVFVEGHDVTARVQAEAGLRDAEERYLALFNGIEQGFCTIEVAFDEHDHPTDYRFLEVSPSFERQTGIVDGAGRWMREIAADQDQHWFDVYGRVARTGESARFENYSTPLARWWEVYAFRISGRHRLAVLFRDITDQKRAEVALRESDARFRLMADAVPQIVWITDHEGRAEFFNKQWSDYTGTTHHTTTADEVAANHVHPDDAAATMAAFDRARQAGTTYTVEHRIRSRAGEYRWFLVRGEPYREAQFGEIVRWFGASVDIHDRKLAEEGLRTLNESLDREVAERTAQLRTYRDIVEATVAPICAFDTGYRLIAFNRAHNIEFKRVNGFETKIGDVFPDQFIPEQQPVMRALMTRALSGESFTVVAEFGRPELGNPAWEITYTPLRDQEGRIVGAFHNAIDISERLVAEAELQAAQEALRQSQKMEAMGSLTGGVAHDFNNLLTPIIGSLDMLVRKGVGSEREGRLIDGALQSAERAKTLVQRLLAFARRQPLQSVPVDVGSLVEGMVGLIGSTLGPAIDVRADLAPDLPPAKADPNQLEMALLNLAVNARDAMPGHGELTIRAFRSRVRGRHPSGLKPGHYVRLAVSDTGTGMDEETRRRAIEPFFSTKGVGKGTGLGLSMVHGLASQLGGGMTIESAPGQGTTVELWLPISTEPIGCDDRTPVAKDAGKARGIALLVDDEELVRMSTADMLIDLGFEVVEAASAEEALQIIQSGLTPDLLVTDHLMPGMSGVDLAREVHDIEPKVAMLVVSGYAELEGIAPELARLTKPFRRTELAASVAALVPDEQ